MMPYLALQNPLHARRAPIAHHPLQEPDIIRVITHSMEDTGMAEKYLDAEQDGLESDPPPPAAAASPSAAAARRRRARARPASRRRGHRRGRRTKRRRRHGGYGELRRSSARARRAVSRMDRGGWAIS